MPFTCMTSQLHKISHEKGQRNKAWGKNTKKKKRKKNQCISYLSDLGDRYQKIPAQHLHDFPTLM